MKANWYLGRIYCDLLKNRPRGLGYYWRVANEFPDIEMGISSPVPWVSLVYKPAAANRKMEKKTQILGKLVSFGNHPGFVNINFGDESGRFLMAPAQIPEVHKIFDPRVRPWYQGAV